MTTRRDFLKKLTLSAFALPLGMQWDFTKSRVDDMSFPPQNDPAFLQKIRKMFPMPEDKAFFTPEP